VTVEGSAPPSGEAPTAAPTQTVPTGPAQTVPTGPTGPTGPAQTVPTGPAQTQSGQPPGSTGSTGPATTMRTFVVGVDMPPGTYRTTGPVAGSPNCFWARMKNTTGGIGDVINAGAPTGPATVTIEAGDKAFQTAGCAQWTKA
jgi:hypothetical protein